MANRRIDIAVILSAYDRMTAVIGRSVNVATQKLTALQKASDKISSKSLSVGRDSIAMGAAAAASLYKPIVAFSDLEDAGLRLKSVMMRDGGILPEKLFKRMNDQAIYLGNLLPGTTAEFQNLYATMLEQGTPAAAVLNGTGKAAAYLAVQLRMPTEQAAILASRLRLQMGIADKEMMQFMDIMARIKNVGVDPVEMQYAFGRSAGVMKLLNVQGLQASKTMGALYAMLIGPGGATGETAGTGISKIMNEIMNPVKMAKFNKAAAQYGLSFEFFRKGKFLGMENFVAQLTKFSGMDPEKITKMLMPLTGGEGTDNQFIASLSTLGAEGFNLMTKRFSEQATLQQKVDLMLTSLKNKWEAATGTFTNSLAAFAGTFAPILKSMSDTLNSVSAKLQVFIEKHPTLFKYLGIGIMLFSSIMLTVGGFAFSLYGITKTISMTAGSIKFLFAGIKILNYGLFALRYHLVYTLWPALVSATTAAWGFTAALLANPITWIVIAVIALGGALVYAYYKSEKFRAAIAGIMEVGKLLGKVFMAAGKIIIGSLTFNPKMLKEGIKETASLAKDIWNGGITKRFNVAYNKSLAASKAAASKPKAAESSPLSKLMPSVGGGSSSVPTQSTPSPVAARKNTVIEFKPVINISGSATQKDAANIASVLRSEFRKLMKEYEQNKMRVQF